MEQKKKKNNIKKYNKQKTITYREIKVFKKKLFLNGVINLVKLDL
jgi:hypothetical protein